ncbi:MAG: hypothetical protein Q4C01_03825 [Clostridia bacterium]|nr:hypothetical protein [Clostridia bacterium]
MKRFLILLFLPLIFMGCGQTEDFSILLDTTEEPIAINRTTKEPEETEEPTPEPTFSIMSSFESAEEPLELEYPLNIVSAYQHLSFTLSEEGWLIGDSAWAEAQELSSEFMYLRHNEDQESLFGIISYEYEGNMDENLQNKAAEVLENAPNNSFEDIAGKTVSAKWNEYELNAYTCYNIFWYEGQRLYRISAVATADTRASTEALIMNVLDTFAVYDE